MPFNSFAHAILCKTTDVKHATILGISENVMLLGQGLQRSLVLLVSMCWWLWLDLVRDPFLPIPSETLCILACQWRRTGRDQWRLRGTECPQRRAFPLLYRTVNWYPCNLSIILCSLRGLCWLAFCRLSPMVGDLYGPLFRIFHRGTDATYPYKTRSPGTLFRFEHNFSLYWLLRVCEVKQTGWSFCNITPPMASSQEGLHCSSAARSSKWWGPLLSWMHFDDFLTIRIQSPPWSSLSMEELFWTSYDRTCPGTGTYQENAALLLCQLALASL